MGEKWPKESGSNGRLTANAEYALFYIFAAAPCAEICSSAQRLTALSAHGSAAQQALSLWPLLAFLWPAGQVSVFWAVPRKGAGRCGDAGWFCRAQKQQTSIQRGSGVLFGAELCLQQRDLLRLLGPTGSN